MNKKEIRKEVLFRRSSITGKLKRSKDKTIEERLLNLSEFQNARAILFYASFRSEVDTFNLINYCLGKNITAALPKVDAATNDLKLYKIKNIDELASGYCGIPEPFASADRKMNIEDMDLIIVPGVAFDELCNRLGYGKGFYDRLLTKKLCPVIALSYEEQILPSIPSQMHDIKIDKIITDKRIIECHGYKKN
ncbi:MAG: 5-formyltetrahydrofolate cyclo-ligase [Thermodesulfovibrio sp.]|nr:5-formyltetrahydrofolate cyclo-ligase [Thermodesulfovibrio sp.]